jgi:hypothetical protein
MLHAMGNMVFADVMLAEAYCLLLAEICYAI